MKFCIKLYVQDEKASWRLFQSQLFRKDYATAEEPETELTLLAERSSGQAAHPDRAYWHIVWIDHLETALLYWSLVVKLVDKNGLIEKIVTSATEDNKLVVNTDEQLKYPEIREVYSIIEDSAARIIGRKMYTSVQFANLAIAAYRKQNPDFKADIVAFDIDLASARKVINDGIYDNHPYIVRMNTNAT